ncbi:hypothetical protein P5704_027050 (plasmid) [Pseudomonas sp. FeN3W]|nr:hypothetical protein P5704_027050 [Pseudomonas sp. FeN3W]
MKTKIINSLFMLVALLVCSYSAQAELIFQKYVPELNFGKGEYFDEKVDAVIVAPKGYTCRLPSKDGYCKIPLIWLTNLDHQASLWRTTDDKSFNVAYGYDGFVEAYVRYEQTLTYSLHDGKEQGARLLDSVDLTAIWDGTDGSAQEKTGELSASENGDCQIYTDMDSCEVSLSWTSQNVESARVWQRTSKGLVPMGSAKKSGSVVGYAFDFSTVYELREGDSESGSVLSATVTKGHRAKPVTGSITFPDGNSCITSKEVGVCEVYVEWTTNDVGRVWMREKPYSSLRTGGSDFVEVGLDGGFIDLRLGDSGAGDILAREPIKAVIGDHSGSMRAKGSSECEAGYQRGRCTLEVDYSATERASIWDDRTRTLVAGGSKSGTVEVPVLNHDGMGSTENIYSLRVHGGGIPRYSNPLLARLRLTATRPMHTGSLTPVLRDSCNMLYSKNECKIAVKVETTSPLSSIWNAQGQRLWSGHNLSTVEVMVPAGQSEFLLREGDDVTNAVLSKITLSALRPSYFTQLSSAPSCTSDTWNGSCTITITVNSNTTSSLYYREITNETEGQWASFATGIASRPVGFGRSGITSNKRYQIEARQHASPYEVLDRIEVDVNVNEPHSLTMKSVSPVVKQGYPCSTYFNSTYCSAGVYLTWDTDANRVTQCWYRSDSNTPMAKELVTSTTGAMASNTRYGFEVGVEYDLHLFEGDATCPSRSSLETTTLRRMWSANAGSVRVMPAAQTPASIVEDTLTCQISYTGAGSCSASMSVSLSAMGAANHRSYPGLYIRRSDNVFSSNNLSSNNGNYYNYTGVIREGEKDVVFELRVMEGSVKSESDPIVDTLIMNHTMQKVVGNVMLGRVYSYSRYYNTTDYTKLASPYFFSRVSESNNFSETSDDCLIHIDESECSATIFSRLGTSSSAASVFIDGEYKGSFSYVIPDSADWTRVSLSIGSHKVELREGLGEGSYKNKLLDSFSIEVARPVYQGYIARMPVLPNIPYINAPVEIELPVQSNTRAWLYNKKTGGLICGVNSWYTAEYWQSHGKTLCKVTLTEGDHEFELRSHKDPIDSNNVIFDSYSFELSHAEQTASVKPNQTYPSNFSECNRTFANFRCYIHFSYINKYAVQDSSALSICVKTVNGTYSKRSSLLAYSDRYYNGSFFLYEDSATAMLVDGPACPSSESDEAGKVLASWEVASNPPLNTINAYVTSYPGWVTTKSTTDPDWSECQLRFEGDYCTFSIRANYPLPMNEPGQEVKAYLAVFSDAGYVTGYHNDFNNIAYSTSSAGTYHIVSCPSSNVKSSTCSRTEARTLATLKVRYALPDYTASIEAPDGDYCQAEYKQSTCNIRLKTITDSANVRLYRDGEMVSEITGKVGDTVFAVPVKGKGETTEFVVRDGKSSTGRILATKIITAETYDPSRFAFKHSQRPGSPDILGEYCFVSGYVASEETNECSFTIGYESDTSTKYLKVVKGDGAGGSAVEISGNGSFVAKMSASVMPFALFESYKYVAYQAEVYSDKELTQLMDVVSVYQRNTVFDERSLVVAGASYAVSNIRVSTSSCGYSCTTYYFLTTDSGKGVALYASPKEADDLVLKTPERCSQAQRQPFSSRVCNVMGYGVATKTIAAGSQSSFTIGYSGEQRVKRIFYSVNSDPANFADPTYTLNGVVRPLLMDGGWHYIDMNDETSASIAISAINITSVSQQLRVNLVAEYYTEH